MGLVHTESALFACSIQIVHCLPKLAKQHLIFFHRMWCPEKARICFEYLLGGDLHPDVIVYLINYSPLSESLSLRADHAINDLLLISHSVSEHDPFTRLHTSK